MDQGRNLKHKTVRLLKDDNGENLLDLEFDNDILGTT
jgi:hypothetical protein